MKILGIIPARFASSRFPGKPLAMLAGKPMLQHVYEGVASSGLFAHIVIATDDDRIASAAGNWGAEVVMTSDKHPTGTDRCAEVLEKVNEPFEVVVNIQGDEPFIQAGPLQALCALFERPEVQIGTLVQQVDNDDELFSPNNVRVVIAASGMALYFSRATLPYLREHHKEDWLKSFPFRKHIGLYAFRPQTLRQIVSLQPSALEKAEMLEQLRWLENGFPVHVAETDYRMLSVDTPEDLSRAEAHFSALKGQ